MIFGHDEKIDFFKEKANEDRLGQAYLFYGEPQIGKFLFAKHLAYFLEYGEFKVSNKTLVDTIIVSPDENGTIGVPDMEPVKSQISQKPFRSSKRLIIIRDAEALTPEAQSSLLKFVEEASDHTSFIFIASDPQILLPPLASRLMEIYFPRLSDKEIKEFLMDKGTSSSKAEKVAQRSFGRPGRALNLLEGKDSDEEDSLESKVSNKIVELFLQDKVSNAEKISWLLDKEVDIKRFNINPTVQEKAVENRAGKL